MTNNYKIAELGPVYTKQKPTDVGLFYCGQANISSDFDSFFLMLKKEETDNNYRHGHYELFLVNLFSGRITSVSKIFVHFSEDETFYLFTVFEQDKLYHVCSREIDDDVINALDDKPRVKGKNSFKFSFDKQGRVVLK